MQHQAFATIQALGQVLHKMETTKRDTHIGELERLLQTLQSAVCDIPTAHKLAQPLTATTDVVHLRQTLATIDALIQQKVRERAWRR